MTRLHRELTCGNDLGLGDCYRVSGESFMIMDYLIHADTTSSQEWDAAVTHMKQGQVVHTPQGDGYFGLTGVG